MNKAMKIMLEKALLYGDYVTKERAEKLLRLPKSFALVLSRLPEEAKPLFREGKDVSHLVSSGLLSVVRHIQECRDAYDGRAMKVSSDFFYRYLRYSRKNLRDMNPNETAADRLFRMRRREVVDAVFDLFRYYSRVGNKFEFVDSLEKCGVDLSLERKNKGIKVNGKWRTVDTIASGVREFRCMPSTQGVPRNCHGLMTLGAIKRPDLVRAGEEMVWDAVWARQGRSDPIVERGWIIKLAGFDRYVHSTSTIGSAHKGAALARAAAIRSQNEQEMANMVARGDIPPGCESVIVTFRDARRAGLCAPGIRAWCSRHGFDPKQGATVAQVLAAGAKDQFDLAVQAATVAILRAVKTPKRKKQPVAVAA